MWQERKRCSRTGLHIIYPWDDPTRRLYWGAMVLLHDGVGVEVCPLVMVKVMKAFVRIVVDQDEQVLHSTVGVRAKRSSASCVRKSVPHSHIILNTCSAAKWRSQLWTWIQAHSAIFRPCSALNMLLKFVGILLATHVLISLAGFCVNFINVCTGTSKMLGSIVFKTYFWRKFYYNIG